jgi:diguanylate cyclase (GGDEF)-like protein/PAS domain S-box-containing protein
MMSWLTQLYPGKLARRLAAYVILFSSVIAMGITAFELASEYFRDVNQIDSRMHQIETAYLDSLTENLWVADKERLDTQLMGIVRQPDFVMAEIRVDGKTLLKRGEMLKEQGITQTFALKYKHRGQLQPIGELVVSASYGGASQRMLDRLLFAILANGAKTFFVAIFILLVFYRLIGRHIDQIARYSHEHSNAENASPLALQRKEPVSGDELSALVDSTNHLRDQLIRLTHEQRERADTLAQQAALLDLQLAARKQAEVSLHLMASVFHSSQEAIVITDANNRIVATNEAFSRLTGYAHEEVEHQNPKILSAGRTAPAVYRQMWGDLNTHGFWKGEVWDRRKDGTIYPKWLSISVVRNQQHEVANYIAIFSDITARKQAEEQIYRLAHHDSLTGLINRVALNQGLRQVLQMEALDQDQLSVMFIDLDRFRDTNDAFGHDIGDQVLVLVAQRLTDSVRDGDLVARLGGDEFVVISPFVGSPESAARIARKVHEALQQPYLIDSMTIHATPSIGLALYPQDGDSGEMLMKRAGTAMYHAKALGRNDVQFYVPGMEEATRDRIQVENELRQGLELGQFELHYQPQIESHTGHAIGVEALVRWCHPERGLVPPAQFIPVAEENGIILPLGEWVLDEACGQMRAWRDQGMVAVTMAVNLSAKQLEHPSLLGFIAKMLDKHDLPGESLELEITESMLMENIDSNIETLKSLRKMGVRLAIDDFGTGYSSLSYLKRLPIDALKLDRSFVKDLETDSSDVAICISTIALAQNLGLKVIAEGVETEGQRDFLTKHRCDVLQGYLFSKPVVPAQAFAFFSKGEVA